MPEIPELIGIIGREEGGIFFVALPIRNQQRAIACLN
jgi:hypothetical protein